MAKEKFHRIMYIRSCIFENKVTTNFDWISKLKKRNKTAKIV